MFPPEMVKNVICLTCAETTDMPPYSASFINLYVAIVLFFVFGFFFILSEMRIWGTVEGRGLAFFSV